VSGPEGLTPAESRNQLRDIEAMIGEHDQEIVDAWHDRFGG
jgi:hypothetical protein